MVRPIRRVVTGHDAGGKAIVVSDGWANRYDALCRIAFILIDAADSDGRKRD